MPQTTQEELADRRLRILLKLIRERTVGINELVIDFHFKAATIKSDIEYLRNLLIGSQISVHQNQVRFFSAGLHDIWRKYNIIGRLGNVGSKKKLAEKVVDFLIDNKGSINNVMLGTGTTMHEVAKEMINRHKDLSVKSVYTTNLLVLHEFIFHKDVNIKVEIAQGKLDHDNALLYSEDGVIALQQKEVDAVITSFNGLKIEDGFSTGQDRDINEKVMNLCPHVECRYVLIPLEWEKINTKDEVIKTKDANGIEKKGITLLADQMKLRKYILFTDSSRRELLKDHENAERDKILEYWNTHGMEVKDINKMGKA